MNKLTKSIARITHRVFSDFEARGGIATDGDRVLSVDELAAENGILPALIWLTKTFIVDDYGLNFASVMDFVEDPQAYTGYRLGRLETEGSSSPTLLSMASYLREIVVPGNVVELDLSGILHNFKIYCAENPYQQIEPPEDDDALPPGLD